MKSLFKKQIEDIINHINVDEKLRIKYGDQDCGDIQKIELYETSPELFISDLSNIIYKKAYINSESFKITPSENYEKELAIFTHSLSKTNTTRSKTCRGWVSKENSSNSDLYIKKNENYKIVKSGQYFITNGVSAFDQSTISIPLQKENRTQSFYYFFGENNSELHETNSLRIYFNLDASAAKNWVHFISSQLNSFQVPFQAKCLSHPSLYNRADSAVLYINKYNYNYVRLILKENINSFKNGLNNSVPQFTFQIEDGIALAESPPIITESFGTSRCKLISESIYNSIQNNKGKSEWSKDLFNKLKYLGFSLEKFYMNPESNFVYKTIN